MTGSSTRARYIWILFNSSCNSTSSISHVKCSLCLRAISLLSFCRHMKINTVRNYPRRLSWMGALYVYLATGLKDHGECLRSQESGPQSVCANLKTVVVDNRSLCESFAPCKFKNALYNKGGVARNIAMDAKSKRLSNVSDVLLR